MPINEKKISSEMKKAMKDYREKKAVKKYVSKK